MKISKHNLIPAVFLILGTLLAIQLGRAVDRSNQAQLALETRITAEQFRFRLESCVDFRTAVVRQLAVPKWENQVDAMDGWPTEARELLTLFPDILALNYVSNDSVILQVFPEAPNQAALGINLQNHPSPGVPIALNNADANGELTRTPVIELLQGGAGIAMYQKFFALDGTQLGFVNGVFRTDELINTCLSVQSLRNDFEFRIGESDGALVHQIPADLSDLPLDVRASAFVDVAGIPWRLDLGPTPAHMLAANSRIESVWVYVGILLVMLLSAAIRTLLLKQESLRDSQEKYRLLIENQSDMVVKIDAGHEFVYVSPSYCTTFGMSEAEIIGKNFMPRVHEEDRELTQKSLDSMSPDNPHCYHEQRALTKDGWRWLAWSNTGIYDEHNALQAITAVGRDITDIKKLKEDIAQSQKMQAIGELASGITHDFNNLLQVMMANIEFLMHSGTDAKERGTLLAQVLRATERAQGLIASLSTLSKQELLIKKQVEINQFAADLITMFKQSLPATVSVSVNLSSEKLYASVDTTQFERVLLNLLINAREAMGEQGNIAITIGKRILDENFCNAHRPLVEPGDFVQISVCDSGRGISPEDLPRIFDPFFSTKSNSKSSGLGLANCYSIVKQLDGLIDVESAERMGTTFHVFLPLSAQPATDHALASADTSQSAVRSKGQILVVDDEPALVQAMTQMLQDKGYEVLVATNGKKALEIYAEHHRSIVLIILDLVMPVMSGQQAAFEMRKLGAVKILFISGYIPETEGRTIQLDAPLLRKPFRTSALLDEISVILRHG